MAAPNGTYARQIMVLLVSILMTALLTAGGASIAYQIGTASRLAALEANITSVRENRQRLERNIESLGKKLDSLINLINRRNLSEDNR
jgi:peptidoglycan hydrolase CwlO-like protein